MLRNKLTNLSSFNIHKFRHFGYTVRNFRKFTKFLFYKGNVKFHDNYDVFE